MPDSPLPSAAPAAGESISSSVNRLAFPIIVENLMQTLLGLVDLALVSPLGAAAIAGVGAATHVVWIYISALAAVSVGTTVLVARFTGARQPAEANRVAQQSILLGLGVAAVLTLVGHLGAEEIIRAIGADEDVVALGGAYLRIVSDTSLFLVLGFILSAALRGAGDSRTPMVATIVANLVNIAVAYTFIYGHLGLPALGVAGSAWGAAAGRTVAALILLAVLWRGRAQVSLRGRLGWAPDVALIRRLLAVGIPSMVEQLLFSGGMLLYSVVVIGLGTVVFATMRIVFMLLSISFLPGFGYALAATTLTSHHLGARDPEMARRSTAYALRMSLVWMSAMGVAFFLFGDRWIRVFTDDPEIVALGAAALKVMAFTQPFQAPAQVFAGALRGAGDTRYPMLVTSISMWAVRLPLAWLAAIPLGLSLPGVLVSAVADAAFRASGAYLRYRTGRWREIRV